MGELEVCSKKRRKAEEEKRCRMEYEKRKAEGRGMLFLEVDGDAIEKTLAPGEVLKVDTGNVVGFETSIKYEVETVKGLGNIFLGGEGLFLTKLVGPGKVILQSQKTVLTLQLLLVSSKL